MLRRGGWRGRAAWEGEAGGDVGNLGEAASISAGLSRSFTSRLLWVVVRISYTFKQVLVKFVGTHAEYDRIDVETV